MKEFYTSIRKEKETVNEWDLRLEEIFLRTIEKGKVREKEGDTTLREQFWKSLRSERLENATRVKYENLQSYGLLRKAEAEESEMKLATNIAQQQTRTQSKTEKRATVHEDKEYKLEHIENNRSTVKRTKKRRIQIGLE